MLVTKWSLSVTALTLSLLLPETGSQTTRFPDIGNTRNPIYDQPRDRNWNAPRDWRREEIPNPQTDIWKCGRDGKRSWVCDPNMLLTASQADEIDRAIDALMHTTGGCHCSDKKCNKAPYGYQGYKAAVVIINKAVMPFSNPSSQEKKKVADDFADYLRDEEYEFGYCNDDLLIFVSKEDRIVYTATGDQMSEILTDHCVDQIFKSTKSTLSAGDYGKALKEMIFQYNVALQSNHECNKPNTTATIVGAVVGVGVIGTIAGAVIYSRKKGGSGGGESGSYHPPHEVSHVRRHSNVSSISKKSAESGGGGGEF